MSQTRWQPALPPAPQQQQQQQQRSRHTSTSTSRMPMLLAAAAAAAAASVMLLFMILRRMDHHPTNRFDASTTPPPPVTKTTTTTTTTTEEVVSTLSSSTSSSSSSSSSLSTFTPSVIMNGRRMLLLKNTAGAEGVSSDDHDDDHHDRHDHHDDTDVLRILYIVTSGGKTYGGTNQARFSNHVLPVIFDTVQSLVAVPDAVPTTSTRRTTTTTTSTNNIFPSTWTVDVYLVLGFDLPRNVQEDFQRQLQVIHPNVGLRVWSEALPLAYQCQEWKLLLVRGAKNRNKNKEEEEEGEEDPVGYGQKCQDYFKEEQGPSSASVSSSSSSSALLQYGKVQLARQHRYIVKDELPNYDYFLAFEDDMYITRQHVEYQMKWMHRIRQWTRVAKEREERELVERELDPRDNNDNNADDWTRPLTVEQLEHLRPAMIRVEVLDHAGGRGGGMVVPKGRINSDSYYDMDFPVPHKNITAWAQRVIDPYLCCGTGGRGRKYRRAATEIAAGRTLKLKSTDLVIWETGIIGLGVRRIPELDHNNNNNNNNKISNAENPWVALMPGIKTSLRWPQYWSGETILVPEERIASDTPGNNNNNSSSSSGGNIKQTTKQKQKRKRPLPPRRSNPELLAQSAGWMASQREVLDFHTKLCTGGSFLPPFDPPDYKQDGIFKNNVEYWSGAIQLWGGTCNIQRFIALDDNDDGGSRNSSSFSKHLFYHTSNNKHNRQEKEHLVVLATTLLSQLRTVQLQAEKEVL